VALLTWTSIAAGVFASANTSHPAAFASHSAVTNNRSVDAHQHGKFQAAGTNHADTMGPAVDHATNPDSACIASCLDAIAAKLAPLPRRAFEPDDTGGIAIASTPLLALTLPTLPLLDSRRRAIGPPDPVHQARSGAARLVLANARLRI